MSVEDRPDKEAAAKDVTGAQEQGQVTPQWLRSLSFGAKDSEAETKATTADIWPDRVGATAAAAGSEKNRGGGGENPAVGLGTAATEKPPIPPWEAPSRVSTGVLSGTPITGASPATAGERDLPPVAANDATMTSESLGGPSANPHADQASGDSEAASVPVPAMPVRKGGKTRTPGVRKVHLSLTRVDPWSVMKLSMLLSFGLLIMTVVATAVLWMVLNSMGVFTALDEFVKAVMEGANKKQDILQFVSFSRVVSASVLIGAVNMLIITGMSTIMALLYNVTASLVGGLHVTFTDE